ncbi:hypothetical protein H0H92_000497 [Tricholoma furcatifolium]|nr:hypothetical protein H0H92_000497 [Tricholoma furcatifolium]
MWQWNLSLDAPDTRIAFSLSILTWLVWDSIILAGREYEHIWRREPSIATRFYLCFRYLGLIAQIINAIYTTHLLSQDYVPSEIILMLRVYALYNRSKAVGAVLCSLWISETSVLVICSVQMTREFRFMPICLVENTPPSVAGVCTAIIFTQLIVWGMTFLKQIDTKYRDHPLIYVVSRDGAIVCTAFIGFFAVMLPYTYRIHTITHSTVACFLSLISILTCRMILNMQDIKPEQSSTFGPDEQNAEQPGPASGHGATHYLDTLCDDVELDSMRERVSQWSWMRGGQSYVANNM